MLVLQPEAEQNVSEAFAWNDARERGLGSDFLAGVEQALVRIEAAPSLHPKVHRDVRRALTRRFPFSVFFVAEPERIVVLAVLHSVRSPRHVGRRARGL